MVSDVFPTVAVRSVRAASNRLERHVEQVAELAANLDDLIRPGMRVFLKPDLSRARHPKEGLTTHPAIVSAVARLVRRRGARALVGDSPLFLRGRIESVWKATGLLKAARHSRMRLVNLERASTTPVAVGTRVYYIARPALEADLVINLPRLRTSRLCQFSGAVKNMMGVVPGFQKGLLYKRDLTMEQVASVMVDVYSAVQPDLTIMDALSHGDHTTEESAGGMLLASTDGVALDVTVARMLGLEPQTVSTVKAASDAGLGLGWMEMIQVTGGTAGRMESRDIQPGFDSRFGVMRRLLAKSLSSRVWMTLRLDETLCESCFACTSNCPTKALRSNEKGTIHVYDQRLCISCWQCYANCPRQAISLESSPLVKRLA